MLAEVIPYRLPLKRPWVAAATTLTERRGALLKLTDADGLTGWGDCAPLPSGGNAKAVFAALRDFSCRPANTDFSRLPAEARWAVETAQADLAAQRAGLPLWQHLGGTNGRIEVNAALGPLDDALPTRLAEAVSAGFRIGKIKVGRAPVEEEISRLKALPATLRLRLDANRAWRDDDARRFLSAIADLPIDGIEEPLAAPTLAKLAALQAAVPYALALDESLPWFGITAISGARAVRRCVLKPARLGGIAATRLIARAAQAAGIEVVLTSVVDSAVGVTAAAHLAAALCPDGVHGLGTSTWLAADFAVPAPGAGRLVLLGSKPGLGMVPAIPV